MNNDTKNCTKCQEVKSLTEFRFRNKKRGTYQSWCKQCTSAYEKQKWVNSPERRKSNIEKNKERRMRNKRYVWDYLKTCSCEICGISDSRVLEFDHINQSEKEFNISDICIRSLSLERVKEEISKCRVLCANCHRIHTRKQLNYWKGDDI